MKNSLKEQIDKELCGLEFSEEMKGNVLRSAFRRSRFVWGRRAAALAAGVLLCGTVGIAVHLTGGKILLNDTPLPDLAPMEVVEMLPAEGNTDEYGMTSLLFDSYAALQNELGLPLLGSPLAEKNPYMLGTLTTDNRDFAILKVDNYILGDTSGYCYLPAEKRYSYQHGAVYASPLSLSVDLILSEEQLQNGWDTDYLGAYSYKETYLSAQGYTVHLLQDTLPGSMPETCAVFVADGIRYTLKGRVAETTMKQVVDTMGYTTKNQVHDCRLPVDFPCR